MVKIFPTAITLLFVYNQCPVDVTRIYGPEMNLPLPRTAALLGRIKLDPLNIRGKSLLDLDLDLGSKFRWYRTWINFFIFFNKILKFMSKVILWPGETLLSIKENILNAFATAFYLGFFYFGPFVGFSMTMLLLSSPFMGFVAMYLIWIFIDRNTPHQKGRRIDWVRSWKLHERFRNYFPLTLVKTANLPPTKNYIFCIFPHGILGVGAHASFAGDNHEFKNNYPGIEITAHTLNSNFYFPFSREYVLALGYQSVSKEAIRNNLLDGQGKASALVIGGTAEAIQCIPDSHTVFLKNRKGFIKLALATGADLVPIYIFGENELYYHYIFPENSIIRNIQETIRLSTGVAPLLFLGRGIFQRFFGFLPFKKPLFTVVGKPIPVIKNESPTSEEVNALHTIFTQELTNLFNKYKHKYLSNPNSANLSII